MRSKNKLPETILKNLTYFALQQPRVMGMVRSAAEKQELCNLWSLDYMMLCDHAVGLVDVN